MSGSDAKGRRRWEEGETEPQLEGWSQVLNGDMIEADRTWGRAISQIYTFENTAQVLVSGNGNQQRGSEEWRAYGSSVWPGAAVSRGPCCGTKRGAWDGPEQQGREVHWRLCLNPPTPPLSLLHLLPVTSPIRQIPSESPCLTLRFETHSAASHSMGMWPDREPGPERVCLGLAVSVWVPDFLQGRFTTWDQVNLREWLLKLGRVKQGRA